jgi:hypothetical protein
VPLTYLKFRRQRDLLSSWGLEHGKLVPHPPRASDMFPTDMEKLLIGRQVEGAKPGLVCDKRTTAKDFMRSVRLRAEDPLASLDTSAMQTTSDVDTLTALLNASDAMLGRPAKR